MLKYIKGNLIDRAINGNYDLIVHGCNCFNNMGAGIAVPIKRNFHDAYLADQNTIRGDRNKLGKYTVGLHNDLIIINAYTQYHWGGERGKVNCDYEAIRNVFTSLNEEYKNKKVGIPLIGAGLANGDWRLIRQIINEVTPDLDIEVVVVDDVGINTVERSYDDHETILWIN